MCRGPPESQLLESCFPPAEHIVSALTGLRALTLPSQLNPNAGKPANYERTSQPAAQPLVKPSLTASTLLLAQSLQAQTNHVEAEKKKEAEVCFCEALVVPFVLPGCFHTLPNWLSCGGNCGGGSLQGQSKVQKQHRCCWCPTLLLQFHHWAAKDLLLQPDLKVQESRKNFL